MVGTNGGALRPGRATRTPPGLLYGPLWSFGHQLGRRCSRYPRSLSVSKPSTPRTPEAATTADRTDSQAKRKEPCAGSNSPATPTLPAAAPGRDAPHGRLPRAHAVPARYPQIQPARPARHLTALSTPSGGKAPEATGLQARPALQPRRWAPKPLRPPSAGKVRARLSARRRDAEPEPVKGGAARGGAGGAGGGPGRAGGRARPRRPTPARYLRPGPAERAGVSCYSACGRPEYNGHPLLPPCRHP